MPSARSTTSSAPLVYGVSKRVLHDPSYAEEVTQEVFLEIWRQAPRFDGSRGSVRAWAATIARRRAVDRVRSEQARRDRQRADAAVADPPPAATDEVAIDRDLRSRATARPSVSCRRRNERCSSSPTSAGSPTSRSPTASASPWVRRRHECATG